MEEEWEGEGRGREKRGVGRREGGKRGRKQGE